MTYYAGTTGAGASLGTTPPTAAGAYTVVASFAGSANYTAAQSSAVPFTIAPGTATIALTSSSSSITYGQAITFAVNVASGVAPEGTVTFLDNGTPLGTVALGGSHTATFSTTTLPFGSHSITATYNSDGNLSNVQSHLAVAAVAQSGTTVALVAHPTVKKKKVASETLMARIEPVPPGGGLPTGNVTFELSTKKNKKIKTTALGTVKVDSGGAAMLAVAPERVLGKVITTIYSGDANFTTSTLTAPKISKQGVM